MKLRHSIPALFILLNVFACRVDPPKKHPVTRYLPDYKNGISLRLVGLSHSRDSLQLDTLENGYDSLQIRIWTTYQRKDTFQIISLKRHNNQWAGEYCESSIHYSKQRDSVLKYDILKKALFPKIGWQSLLDSLLKQDIKTLPDCTKLTNYALPTDGANTVIIETSTIDRYRLYMYEVPTANAVSFPEAAKVDRMLKLISSQFDVKFMDDFDNGPIIVMDVDLIDVKPGPGKK